MPATFEQKITFRTATKRVFSQIQEEFLIIPRIGLIQSAHESNWGISQLATEGLNIFGMTPGSLWQQAMNKQINMIDVPAWSAADHATVYFPTTEHSDHPPEQIHYWDFSGDIVSKRSDGKAVLDEHGNYKLDEHGNAVNKGGSICMVNRHFRKYVSWDESAWDWARKIAKSPLYLQAYEFAKGGDLKGYAHELHHVGYANDPNYELMLLNEGEVVDALPAETTA